MIVKTIKVMPWGKGQGEYVEINEADFDKRKHVLHSPQRAAVKVNVPYSESADVPRVAVIADTNPPRDWLSTQAPTHTDLMVTPESIDKFMEANPLPVDRNGESDTDDRFHIVKGARGKFYVKRGAERLSSGFTNQADAEYALDGIRKDIAAKAV